MKKTVWTFGLIAGGILSAMMLLTTVLSERIGYDRGEIIGYTTMVGAFLLIFFGVRSYRDNVLAGRVTFRRAFGVGLLITLIASVCYTATWQVVYFGMNTGFVEKYQAYQLDQARAKGAGPAEIAKRQAELQRFAQLYDNPVINFGITMLEPLPVGLVLALVSAGILSRRRRSGIAIPGAAQSA